MLRGFRDIAPEISRAAIDERLNFDQEREGKGGEEAIGVAGKVIVD